VKGPGLRLQIVLALAGIILLAYLPLFFAIAQVTRATSQSYREDSARSIGRAVAAHVADVDRREPAAVQRTIEAHVGEGGAASIAVFAADGTRRASAGNEPLSAPAKPWGEAATRIGRSVDIAMPAGEGLVVVRVRADEDSTRSGNLVRLIALYMTIFALALLFVAYLVLTRAIVRPIEQLARAADKVATGARSLEVPRAGAREIADLGSSVHAMAARLLADEDKLRTKVNELTSTTKRLTETREQLEGSERMASVGKLAAGVAHEIGNPIAAIMGMHDLLDDGELPNEDRADFLRRMRKETERIHVVVRDLLDYARPEAGPPSGKPHVASVAEIAADALALVKPQKEWRAIETKVDVAADARVALSPQRLTQVLLNLLLNAGAVEPKTVTVRTRTANGKVRIEVEDDGPGVPKDLRDRIFDPFVTTKDVGAGTGLGLSVCRGIIEAAKGRIYVDPSYEGGARFVVELPSIP
jgi:two-component system, NtrC family, sensor kinase